MLLWNVYLRVIEFETPFCGVQDLPVLDSQVGNNTLWRHMACVIRIVHIRYSEV